MEVQHGCQRWTIDVVKHIAGLIQILLLVSVDSPQHAKVDQQTHNVNHVASLVLGFQIEMNTRSLEAGIGGGNIHEQRHAQQTQHQAEANDQVRKGGGPDIPLPEQAQVDQRMRIAQFDNNKRAE